MSLKLSSKTITGSLQNLNRWTCDWGWQGFIAYGCQNLITVIDPRTVQVIQTLDKHQGYVVKVKWAKENYHHDLASPYVLTLASADYNGKVIVWDVTKGSIVSEFSDGTKPVADMEWLRTQDTSQDLLAVLHPPYSLVLWNAITGTKIWKKSYTEVLQAFTFDPFDSCKLAFLGQDCIVFVDDFSLSKTPSSNGKKYYISSPNAQGMNNSTSSEKINEKKSTTKSTMKIVSSMLVGDSSKSKIQNEDVVTVNDCLQLIYHPACRHHLIMLYAKELLVLDLEINQTVGIISMERNSSAFVQVLPMRQRDVFMCLHENGSITARVRRKRKEIIQSQPSGEFEDISPQSQGLNYDLRSQSDAMRLTRHVKVYGTAYCPVSENKVSVLLSDGRVLLWELTTVDFKPKHSPQSGHNAHSPLYTPGASLPKNFNSLIESVSKLNLNSSVSIPKTALSDLLGQFSTPPSQSNRFGENKLRHEISLKFILKGLLYGVASDPTILKMCPPLTTKNWAVYEPLLAVGTSNGSIQIFNVSGGYLTKEFSIHTSAVRGIEWCSLHSFMSYTSSQPNSNGLVKNEIILTDIQTGRTNPIRTNRDEESPIEMIKISYLKQYFVVVFKEKPFELWELKTGTMLRQMPRHFPKVTALEWSPSHGSKSLKKKSPTDSLSFSGSAMDLSASTPSGETPSGLGSQKSLSENATPLKEHFVFTDTEGLLYHFIIEGNMVKDGSKIPPDGSMSQISSLAWKGDTLVLGDVDGNLNVWDLKQRISKAIPTHKGWVKKMKFAPGRGNMKLLVVHTDGADIWEAKNCEMLSTVRTPKDICKIIDADWVASDKPAFACADSCVRILDVTLRNGCSALSEYQLQDLVFSPYLITPKASLSLKSHLQHQPWNETYNLCVEETEDNSDIFEIINNQLELIEQDIKDYLCNCPFGTAQRCLITAKLFGDESDLNFWSVALHYLRHEKAGPSTKKLVRSQSSSATIGNLFIPSTPSKELMTDLGNLESECSKEDSMWQFVRDSPLESCYDILCDSETFQKYQLERISLHDQKRTTYEHTKKCAENLMMLGQADRAVQLLLETDAGNDSYYIDNLRACLVASIRSSGASQSTIKLVATNLIANGKLSEGVQLLCLIEKGMDACRYLQTYGEWHQAAWLAKASLDFSECCEVMKRWSDHLNTPQVNLKTLSVLILLSLGQFSRVIEMLYSLRQFDRAALLVESCKEFGVLSTSQETRALSDAVFLEYSRYLLHLGNRKAAEYYCKQAGEKGKLLLTEIVAAFSP